MAREIPGDNAPCGPCGRCDRCSYGDARRDLSYDRSRFRPWIMVFHHLRSGG